MDTRCCCIKTDSFTRLTEPSFMRNRSLQPSDSQLCVHLEPFSSMTLFMKDAARCKDQYVLTTWWGDRFQFIQHYKCTLLHFCKHAVMLFHCIKAICRVLWRNVWLHCTNYLFFCPSPPAVQISKKQISQLQLELPQLEFIPGHEKLYICFLTSRLSREEYLRPENTIFLCILSQKHIC